MQDGMLMNVSKRFLEFIKEEEVLELATHTGFRVYNNNVTLPADTFNITNGVEYDISGYLQMSVPKDPVFISRVSDLWLMNRPTF